MEKVRGDPFRSIWWVNECPLRINGRQSKPVGLVDDGPQRYPRGRFDNPFSYTVREVDQQLLDLAKYLEGSVFNSII